MSEYRDALQPLTQSASARQSTKILKELAPQLLHPRILTSAAFLNGPASSSSTLSAGASSSSSSSSNTSRSLISLSNPQNAFVALARLRNNPLIQAAYSSDGRHGSASANGRSKGKGPSAPRTSTDLHILEGIDRLLDLPVPPMSLSTVPEEGDGEGENEDNETETAVSLFEGFRATIPSASSRKLARRRKRAGISERALGITAGADELGLRERGQRAAASSTSAGETSGGLGLLSAGDEYTVDSIESTPRRRTIKAKRRSSFMPSLASKQQQQQQQQARKEHDIAGEPIETLTRPELESDLKEINMDKDALKVRRRLVVRDLEVLEAKIKKLEDIKLELGNKLLELKEEELELDDELEGVTDRLSQLEAINAGRVVSSTSSRRRKGPAFLPSEHDDLPANVAFMSIATAAAARAGTRAGASSKADYMSSQSSSSGPTAAPAILALDFSEPYGLLVASTAPRYASQASSSSVSVFDLTDGEELARLHGHRGGVKCLLVEGDLCITGGRDGTIAIWDLPAAVEEGMERERERERDRLRRESDRRQGKNRVKASSAASDISSQRSAGRDGDGDEDVFSASSAGKLNGQKASVNGDVAEREDYLSSMDGDKADEEEDEWPLLPSPGAALRSYRAMQMQQQQQQHHLAQASQTPTSRPPLVGHGQYSETRQEQQDEDEELDEPDGSVPSASRLRVLEGHSKDVTCISYEDNSLVSGSSDKTLRLWDMTTGQCVVTMDILWAISNPLPAESEEDFGVGPGGMAGHGHGRAATAASAEPASYNASGFDSPGKEGGNPSYPWHASSSYMTPRTKRSSLSGLRRLSSQSYGLSSMTGSPMTPTAVHPGTAFLPGSGGGGGAPTPSLFPGEDAWDTGYDDFVGGIQLWSYALASGSADGCVRMWDTRTGQSVRSLVGHTSAVTCLQFDNFHLVSGARDRSVRVWDLRTGRTIDTLRYPGRVTDLQFDTRRILVANDASNAVSVYNRTTLQQTELAVNGHAGPVEKLRFMDRYLATGGQDGLVKIWSLA